MRYFIYIFLIIAAYGCNNNVEAETKFVLKELMLNKGKPWQVNKETHIGISKMDSLITNFKEVKGENYTPLGELLSKQTGFIIKNCSMAGIPHDQLHIILVPMLDEISIIRENDDIATKKVALSKLQIYVNKYFEYFTIE